MKTIKEIQKKICEVFNIGISDLLRHSKQERHISTCRAISVVICHKNGFSKPEIMKAHNMTRQAFDYCEKMFNKALVNDYYARCVFEIYLFVLSN